MEGGSELIAQKLSAVALAYAWCKVCFTAWDATLDYAGEQLLGYSRWPPGLRAALQALYPAYFVFTGAQRLRGPDGPARGRDARRFAMLLCVACATAAVLGNRSGARNRANMRRTAR
jgi:hypothetical protein